jgi:oligosaccharide repeat unit polymerase
MNDIILLPTFYASLFALSLYMYWRKCKSVNGGFIVLLIWTISAIAGAWYENNLIFEHIHEVTFLPYLYLFFMAMMLCWPLLKYRTEKIIFIIGNSQILNFSIFVIAFVNIIPFFENLIHFVQGIRQGAVFNLETFNAKYEYGLPTTWYMSEIGSKCQQIASSFRLYALVLFFHYFIRPKSQKNRKLQFALILSVSNIVLMGINSGSRNTLFTYLVLSFYLYFIFTNFYSKNVKSLIKKYASIFVTSVVILFVVISVIRFKDIVGQANVTRTLPQWITSYAGESHGIFNADDWYLKEKELTNNDFIKSFYLYKIFGIIDKPKENTSYTQEDNYKNFQFSTVVGTYYRSYGRTFTTLAIILVTFLFLRIISYEPQQKISNILLLVYYAKIPLMGFSLFAYMFDGWQLLITPVIIFLLKLNKS